MFQANKYIDTVFGGPEALRNALSAAGFNPPKLDSVQKWSRRNSIPGEWLAASMAVQEINTGSVPTITEFFNGEALGWHLSSKTKSNNSGISLDVFE